MKKMLKIIKKIWIASISLFAICSFGYSDTPNISNTPKNASSSQEDISDYKKNVPDKLEKISDDKIIVNAIKVGQIIKDNLGKIGIPGCNFVVARKDRILHVASFGKVDIRSPKKNTSHTLFPVSSVSKNVTAILVGILVDKGYINWNDKVRKYLPDFFMGNEELSNEITILDLISHRSGFKHFSADSLFSADYDKFKILRAFKFLKPIPGKFRKCYGYQNIVYGVIGNLIEKV
ncbi:MAG: beta-lactamase family protein, partial [Holosporales bacterium]|nr:beta-lactamase family protein [Holosporales bacterium]